MSFFDIFKKRVQTEIKKPNDPDPKLLELVKSLEKNEIVMNPNRDAENLRADGSRIGGMPYLPEHFEWPTYTSNDDGICRPLSFLCQINLADVKPLDSDNLLPGKGILSFFYECEAFCWGFDPEDRGSARVFFFESTDGFVLKNIPDALADEYTMPMINLDFSARKSYPGFEEFDFLTEYKCDWEEYDEALKALGADTENDPEDHKLLGYADLIQSEMLTECERAVRGLYSGDPESYRSTPEELAKSIDDAAKDWTLLLQLYTIETDDFEWMFGDCGMIYFYIKKDDLAAGRFDNGWFSVQCG